MPYAYVGLLLHPSVAICASVYRLTVSHLDLQLDLLQNERSPKHKHTCTSHHITFFPRHTFLVKHPITSQFRLDDVLCCFVMLMRCRGVAWCYGGMVCVLCCVVLSLLRLLCCIVVLSCCGHLLFFLFLMLYSTTLEKFSNIRFPIIQQRWKPCMHRME